MALFLLIAFAGTALADDNKLDIQVGKMNLKFSSEKGFSLGYNGAAIIKESTIHVVTPGWINVYYSYDLGAKVTSIKDIPGGKEVILHQQTNSFVGDQKITILPNKVTFDYTYKLTVDSKNTSMEYSIGRISAPLIAGCPFKAETLKGSVSMKIPFIPEHAEEGGADMTENRFNKIAIESRIGTLSFECSGKPDTMNLYDARGVHVDWAEKSPILEIGSGVDELNKDEINHSVVSITIDPLPEQTAAAAELKNLPAPVQEIKDLHKTTPKPVVVIPEPQEMKLLDQDFTLSDQTQIVVADQAADEDFRGAESFAAEVRSLYGIKIPILREHEVQTPKNLILVGEAAKNQMIAKAAAAINLSAPDKEEGYALKVIPEQILVLGHDQRGSYYGMQTLKQLVKVSAEAITVQGCKINDFPSLKFRGVLMFTGKRALPFHKKLIDKILSRFKMNEMVMEADLMKWKSAPNIVNSISPDQEDVRKDVEYAKDHFIEIIPEVASLGHMEWMFNNKQNRDLAEDPEHPYAYCPSNPKSYDFIYKIYDEAIDVFNHPRYFHIGHDEVVGAGTRFPYDETCKKKSVGDLFIGDTLKLHEYLKKKGIRTIMWGDMLLGPGESPDACNAADKNEAARRRSRIPKDITVTDWHYTPSNPDEFQSLKLFKDEGLGTIATTWYTTANIQNFSTAAKNNGSLGILQATWAGFDCSEDNLKSESKQYTVYVLAAEYAWNSGKISLGNLPYRYDEVFFNQLYPTSPERKRQDGFTIDLDAYYNIKLADNAENTGWMGMGAGEDLSAVPVNAIRLGDDIYKLAPNTQQNSAIRLVGSLDHQASYPVEIEVSVGKKANSLLFLQTCAWADTLDRTIGTITIYYEDGLSNKVDLVYGKNIAAWNDNCTCPNASIAWNSITPKGQKITLRQIEWKNPNPQKRIDHVEIRSAGTEAGLTLLGISGITGE